MALNFSIIFRMAGFVTLIVGISMIPPTIVSFLNDSPKVYYALLATCVPTILIGAFVFLRTKNKGKAFKIRDGYFAVTLSWMLASIIGALPYFFSGSVDTLIDAIFESSAAFTTTGCSIIGKADLSMGISLWKAITHWLGGMGILVFAISILPALGVNGLKLASAEAPGPTFNKVKNKLSDSTKSLYVIYVALTLIEFILLYFSEMNLFEAVINTLGSISTSGLASTVDGIAQYDSFYIEMVITTFTFLASINFMLFYFVLQGKVENLVKDVEARTFALIIFVSFIVIGISLHNNGIYPTVGEAMRASLFQTVSFSSTSGYFIADYTTWPFFTQIILFSLMCVGGCAASTCGSLKVIRLIVLFKLISRGFRKRLHPRSVVAVRLGENVVPAETVSSITSFTMFYMLIYLVTTLVLSLDNLDMTTTFTATAGILSNTGLAFGELGPTNDFSIFSEPMRLFISFMMIVGRLELFTVLLLFTPYFWNSEK